MLQILRNFYAILNSKIYNLMRKGPFLRMRHSPGLIQAVSSVQVYGLSLSRSLLLLFSFLSFFSQAEAFPWSSLGGIPCLGVGPLYILKGPFPPYPSTPLVLFLYGRPSPIFR